jgi:glutamate-1-semialdehyde 2,1-aminomutase
MNELNALGTLGVVAAAAALAAVPLVKRRLELSLAKHPSLTGHSRMARRVASLVPGYAYDEARFFASDGAPAVVLARRRAGFFRLAGVLGERHAKSIAMTRQVRGSISDLQFTSAYRVPFQYGRVLREHLSVGSFVQRSDGVTLTDLDGQRFYDLTGSYGVNVFGNDFYKATIEESLRRAGELGPVLGSYHPAVAYNVAELERISGLDEVSFHMSGTEAVMQAVLGDVVDGCWSLVGRLT